MTTQEALLKLLNLPPSLYSGVCRTSDGFYLAERKGDIGYNAFLGRPSKPHDGPGREMMLNTWYSLSQAEKEAVIHLAAHPQDGAPILLEEDFGVPVKGK